MNFKRIAKKRRAKARKGWGWAMIIFALMMLVPTENYSLADNLGFFAFFAVIGIPLLVWGYMDTAKWNKLEACVNNAGNTVLADAATKMGKSEKWVANELQKMINAGFFATPQGHNAIVDTVEGLFIVTKNGEPLVDVSKDMMARKKRKEKEAAERSQSETVRAIRQAIAVTEDKEAVQILKDLEKSFKKVENTLIAKPDLEQDKMVIKMRTEYIPVILDLIKKLNNEAFTDETKSQIKETLVTCTEAFDNLNKSLNENDNTMTQVDIEVIKSKLASEGYLDPDFDI